MLDVAEKDRGDAAFSGQALPFSMNNATEESNQGSSSGGSDKGTISDPVTACLDSKRQKIVPLGEYYYADACTLCKCSNAEFMCKQISCAPPEQCDGYLKKEPMHCCDVCVPAVVVERPTDSSSLNMKLGAMTVALLLVVSLILFTLHRMRRKRLMVSIRRLQALRRHDSICSESANANSVIAANGGIFGPPDTRIFVASDHAAIITGSPPSYNAAVTLPRAPESLAWAPPRCSGATDPPPAYYQAVQEAPNVRRSSSRRVRTPTSVGYARHSWTSDYPDEAETRSVASSATSSSSSSSSSVSSLSSSQDTLNAVDGVPYDCPCSCSHCDSGLSEERYSLSSNDVRPRSHVYLANSSGCQLVLGQPAASQASQQLLPQGTSQPHASLEDGEDGRINQQSCRENTDGQRQSGGKLCKRKLKKLMMKAKKKKNKAERTRSNERGECSGNRSVNDAAREMDLRSGTDLGIDQSQASVSGMNLPGSNAGTNVRGPCGGRNQEEGMERISGDVLPVSSV